jgi:hypothetical protein
MRRVISASTYCSTLSYTRHDFRRKKIEHKMCVSFSFQLGSETFLILWRIRYIIVNLRRSFCAVPLILVKFLWNLNFLGRFSSNPQISDLIKISPVRAVLFHADRQTWQSLIIAVRNLANAPNNRYFDANIFLSLYLPVPILIAPFTYYIYVLHVL